jgi:hypothetical protein
LNFRKFGKLKENNNTYSSALPARSHINIMKKPQKYISENMFRLQCPAGSAYIELVLAALTGLTGI